ncbi:MAG: tRNA (adenosine(37)-N6)-threonylcarbamoyltransferase complex ATPase subunit type 1 TsaE [Candidatus Limnocylindria bacterium]
MQQSTARSTVRVARAIGSRVTRHAAETHELGHRIGAAASAGTVLALIGPLGAGKTQLTKGIAAGLGIDGVVNSPTFILMNEHVGRLRLYHVDAYRLGEPEEAVEAGLIDDRQADGVLVVEWADRLGGYLPDDRLEIRLTEPHGEPTHRLVHWSAAGAAHVGLADAVLATS